MRNLRQPLLEKNRRWILEIQRPDWITVGPLFFSEKNKKSGYRALNINTRVKQAV
jgi:hypothetical protein